MIEINVIEINEQKRGNGFLFIISYFKHLPACRQVFRL